MIKSMFNYITKPTLSVFEFVSIGTIIMLIAANQWILALVIFPVTFIIQTVASFKQQQNVSH